MGAGFCPQKCVWRPLAASQMLCLPRPWVGKIRSPGHAATDGSDALRLRAEVTDRRCHRRPRPFSCYTFHPPQSHQQGRKCSFTNPRTATQIRPEPAGKGRDARLTLRRTAAHRGKQGGKHTGASTPEKNPVSLYCAAGFDKRREPSLGPRHASTLQSMPALP